LLEDLTRISKIGEDCFGFLLSKPKNNITKENVALPIANGIIALLLSIILAFL